MFIVSCSLTNTISHSVRRVSPTTRGPIFPTGSSKVSRLRGSSWNSIRCVLVWLVVSRLVPFLNVLLASKCLSHRLRATLSLSFYFSLSLALDGYRSTVLFFPWFQVARYLAGVCNDSALCHSGRAGAAMLPFKGGFPLTFRNVRDVNVFMKVAVLTQYLTISVRMFGTF